MKKLHLAVAAFVAIAAGAAQAQVSVGASININVPGVYGRVDIGAPVAGVVVAPPPVVYAQPVVITPSPIAVQQRPIYLYVSEAEQRDWRHHCAAYRACGQPVYFVKEQWVRDRYTQHYPNDHRFDHPQPAHDQGRRGHDDHDNHGRGHDKNDDRDHDRDHH